MIMTTKKRYISRCYTMYSAGECINPGWRGYYLFGYFLILIFYIIVPMHNPQNMLIRNLCFLTFFAYSFYNILRLKSPVGSELFASGELLANSNTGLRTDTPQQNSAQTYAENEKYRFADKMPEYKVVLERWMQTQKPYLNKDFKLLDVMQVLPLNRSYLSRMFNEAYGETFFSFIMRYRIEESVKMLDAYPELTVAHIAQRCGFSSASVFGRAFLKNKGMTPKEYRNR